MSQRIGRLSILCLLLSLSSCKSEAKGPAPTDDTVWPTKPADGTPLVFEFIKLVGEGNRVRASMRVFNFTDKKAMAASMTLHYQDADGNDVKTFPWSSQVRGGLVEKNGHAIIKLGAFMPKTTTKVVVELQEVRFADQTAWKM